MKSIQLFVQRNVYTLLLLLIAGGFLLLSAELILMHHTDGIQLVAVVASLAGAVFAVAGLFASGAVLRNSLAVLFLLLSVSGVVGAFEHFEVRSENEARRPALLAVRSDAAQTVSFTADEDEEGRERGEGGEGAPPPLAPLSLAGFSILGATVLLGRRDGGV